MKIKDIKTYVRELWVAKNAPILAAPVDRDLPHSARSTELHRPVLRLELQRSDARCRFRFPAARRGNAGGIEAGRSGCAFAG